MKMRKAPALTVLSAALLGSSGLAIAHDAGDWIVRFGASNVAIEGYGLERLHVV